MPIEITQPTTLLVTPREASRLLSVSERTLYALVRRGELAAVRIGPRGIRYDVDDLRNWIRAAKVQPAAASLATGGI